MTLTRKLVPSRYTHTQSSAASTWTVVHNLGGNGTSGIPIVDVIVDDGGVKKKIMPLDITIVDKQTLSITFSTNQTGTAVVIM